MRLWAWCKNESPLLLGLLVVAGGRFLFWGRDDLYFIAMLVVTAGAWTALILTR